MELSELVAGDKHGARFRSEVRQVPLLFALYPWSALHFSVGLTHLSMLVSALFFSWIFRSGSIPVLTWLSAAIFWRKLSFDAGGPRLGSFHAWGPKLMAEVSSCHVITPVSANCHQYSPISLVPVAESHDNASLPINCPKPAWSSVTSSESTGLPLTYSHLLVGPAWTENSAQKQIMSCSEV